MVVVVVATDDSRDKKSTNLSRTLSSLNDEFKTYRPLASSWVYFHIGGGAAGSKPVLHESLKTPGAMLDVHKKPARTHVAHLLHVVGHAEVRVDKQDVLRLQVRVRQLGVVQDCTGRDGRKKIKYIIACIFMYT